jgi:DNA-binding LytR/AlgR family response regulator
LKCIIVDDELTARTIVNQLCLNAENLEIVDQFSNAMDAIKYLNKHQVDLIFLDIHMPNFSGMDFVETLKNPPNIILTTSDRNFAIEAFEYDCIVDYLVKPILPQRFLKAIKKIEKHKITQIDTPTISPSANGLASTDVFVNIDKRLVKIAMQSITLIKAQGDYIEIKTDTKNYTVHNTLKSIQDKLPDRQFLKVHRSYIINVRKIIDIEDNSVLINKDVIPVSRANRPELMRRLNLL